ncbi:MAG: hypothetical protein PHW54_02530, partial [Candidatus Omnitrophica bacterium]|nr:hypothetical protein [Candidatus Omnitrophota bacterium]
MIMKKPGILKISYFVVGAVIYLFLSYQLTIFLKRIERRERLPRVLMSVYKGPSVAISGNMVFNG